MDCVIIPHLSHSTPRMLQPRLQMKSRVSALNAILLFLGCSALHAQTTILGELDERADDGYIDKTCAE